MEYLIARKVKAVFNVYREVFHARMDKAIITQGNVTNLILLIDENHVIDARDMP
jgi:hypothetical protein